MVFWPAAEEWMTHSYYRPICRIERHFRRFLPQKVTPNGQSSSTLGRILRPRVAASTLQGGRGWPFRTRVNFQGWFPQETKQPEESCDVDEEHI